MGSPARVKIMRLFLLNSESGFSNKEVAKKSRTSSPIARRELKLLASVKFIRKQRKNWFFNPSFKYALEIKKLLAGSDDLDKKAILSNFNKAGKIKFLLVSGIFIKNKDSRVDLLIVGDKIKRKKVEEGIRKLEAEIGTELVYAMFDTKEFFYRLNMYDKLIRDIFDFPHEIVLQTKELSTQTFKEA